MSITNRLSVFLLVVLALVLSGFAATIYGLASWHLHAQLERQLAASLETLIAAIEVHAENVTWEPHERHVVLGIDPDLRQVRWALYDDQAELIDCSENLTDGASVMLPTNSNEWRQEVRRMHGSFRCRSPRALASCHDTCIHSAVARSTNVQTSEFHPLCGAF